MGRTLMRKIFKFDVDDRFKHFSFKLSSTDEDDYGKYSRLYIGIWKYSLIVKLPPIIKPQVKWVDLSDQNWCKPGLDGRKGYTNYIKRSYGFTYIDSALHIDYGIQPGSWTKGDPENSDHSKMFNMPWSYTCLLYTSPSPRDGLLSRMPSSA